MSMVEENLSLSGPHGPYSIWIKSGWEFGGDMYCVGVDARRCPANRRAGCFRHCAQGKFEPRRHIHCESVTGKCFIARARGAKLATQCVCRVVRYGAGRDN